MSPSKFSLVLHNPIWSSLNSVHAPLAEWDGDVVRYPATIGPFAAVAEAGTPVDVEELLRQGDVNFAGVMPELRGEGFHVEKGACLQMVFTGEAEAIAAIEGEFELTLDDSAEMVELIEVAYPGYFRPETPRLGRYVGIRRAGQLVAMAGERMRMDGFCEISGVCTRPGHTGQGFATHLIRRLLPRITDERPFLHVDSDNARAIQVYRGLGFEANDELALIHISAA